MPYKYTLALVAFGSNQSSVAGGPRETVLRSMELLKEQGCPLERVSPLYTTPGYPAGSGPDFINAVAQLRYQQEPAHLLEILHNVESQLQRRRDVRWGQRTVDLDLLAVEDVILPDADTQALWRALPLERQMKEAPDKLILPHPRIQDRAFVLVPLCDIAPDWTHPTLGKTAREMLNDLPEQDKEEIKLAE